MDSIDNIITEELAKFDIYELIYLYEDKIDHVTNEINDLDRNNFLCRYKNKTSIESKIKEFKKEMTGIERGLIEIEELIRIKETEILKYFKYVTSNIVDKFDKIKYLNKFNKYRVLFLTLKSLDEYVIAARNGKIEGIVVGGYRIKGENYSNEIQYIINTIKKYDIYNTNNFIIDPKKTNITDYISTDYKIGCNVFFIVCAILVIFFIPLSIYDNADLLFISIPLIGFLAMQICETIIYDIKLQKKYNIGYLAFAKRISIIKSLKYELFVSVIKCSGNFRCLQKELSSLNEKLSKLKNLKYDKTKKLSDESNSLENLTIYTAKKEMLEFDHKNYLAIYEKLLEIKIKYEHTQKEKQDYWLRMSGHEFEREIAKLFETIDPDIVVRLTSGSDDGGIDLIIKVDNQIIPVQCKNHSRPVSPGAIRDFQGAITTMKNVNKSIFISSNGFSERAYYQASKTNTLLVDINHILKLHNLEEKAISMFYRYLWA